MTELLIKMLIPPEKIYYINSSSKCVLYRAEGSFHFQTVGCLSTPLLLLNFVIWIMHGGGT